VIGPTEAGDLVSEGARIDIAVADFGPAAAVREEGDIGGTAGEHVDDAVADHTGAAADLAAIN
jgi:hypothetical protein